MNNSLHFDGVRYLPLKDAAQMCGVAPEVMEELCGNGFLHGREIAGVLYISKVSIDNFRWDRVQPRKKEKRAPHKEKPLSHLRVPPKEFLDMREKPKRRKPKPSIVNAVLTGVVAAVAFLMYVAVTPVTLTEIAVSAQSGTQQAAAALSAFGAWFPR